MADIGIGMNLRLGIGLNLGYQYLVFDVSITEKRDDKKEEEEEKEEEEKEEKEEEEEEEEKICLNDEWLLKYTQMVIIHFDYQKLCDSIQCWHYVCGVLIML